jgi:hypothetical protein
MILQWLYSGVPLVLKSWWSGVYSGVNIESIIHMHSTWSQMRVQTHRELQRLLKQITATLNGGSIDEGMPHNLKIRNEILGQFSLLNFQNIIRRD